MQVSSCDTCQRVNRNPLTVVPELHPIPVHSPWYHVGMDFIGPIHPISKNGNRFVLTLSDYFTKWVEAIPLPSKCASGVAKSLFKVHHICNAVSHNQLLLFKDVHEDGVTKSAHQRSRRRI